MPRGLPRGDSLVNSRELTFMKILKFFLKFFLILFVLFFISASIYVRIYGKSIVEQGLNTALKRNVVLGNASYHFPFGLSAKDVIIARSTEGGEFLRVKKVIAQLSADTVYKGKLAFDLVAFIEPVLFIEGKKSVSVEAPVPAQSDSEPSDEQAKVPSQSRPGQASPVEVTVRHLVVKKGKVRYKEEVAGKGFTFDLEDVQAEVENLIFPLKEGRSAFVISGLLIKEGNVISGSRARAEGWVDVYKKDMEAGLEVTEADGTVGLTARAVSKDNAMDVSGEIKMQNLLKGFEQKVSPDAPSVNNLILNALSSSGVQIGAKFAFKTRMDNFRVGQVSFSGSVVTK